jgi:hypothetical protein
LSLTKQPPEDGGLTHQPDASICKPGAKGEFEWCPTLAVAMPDEVFWPGQSRRDHVKQVAEQGQAREKKKAESSKKDSET